MLPKILSGFFQASCVLITIVAFITIASQVLERPLSSLTVDNKLYSFGRPGIQLAARKKDRPPPKFSLVTVSFTQTGDDSTIKQTGPMVLSGPDYDLTLNMKHELKSKLGVENMPKSQIERNSETVDKFRITPSNRWQQAGIVVNDLIRYGCPALLLLGLARLFRNFSNREYFTLNNVVLLRRTGWLLLIPQFLAAFVFWIFLAKINLSELLKPDEADTGAFAFYDAYAEIDWTLILMGLGLLILSYIFRDGLKLKLAREHTA